MGKKFDNRMVVPLLVSGITAGVTVAAYPRVIRPWLLHWGTTGQEGERVLPGDDLVFKPKINSTRAITINAPMQQVWQWVIQVGQYRGGLYAGKWIENLTGADSTDAAQVLAEFQQPQVGDYVLLYPNMPGYAIATSQAPQYLVLQTVRFETGEFTHSVSQDGMHGTMTFFLEPCAGNQTRLLVRTRIDYEAGSLVKVAWGMLEPLVFVLERRMLRGIKARAENARARGLPAKRAEPSPVRMGDQQLAFETSAFAQAPTRKPELAPV